MSKERRSGETTLDTPDLAAKIRARDEDSIRVVVEAYSDQIFRTARGAGLGPQEAEDITQSTFTAFVESAPRFEGRSHVRTWLFGILYRKLAETRRQLEKDSKLDAIDDVFEEHFRTTGTWSRPPRPTDARVLNRELRAEIEDCLAASPMRQRMAFLLREVEGLSTDEIREVLGVSGSNLGVMLYRIRNRLRECLESKAVRS